MTCYLINYLSSKRFVLTDFCFKKVLKILSSVNNLLQRSDLDLLAVIQNITEAQLSINKLRQNGESFNDLVDEVNSSIDGKK